MRDAIAGGPVVIDLFTSGNVTLDVGSVDATNTGAGTGYAIGAISTGTDTLVSVTVDETTASGTGRLFGIIAQGPDGADVLVNAGSVQGIGDGGYGVWAIATTGDVAITTGTITTTGGVRSTTGGPRPSHGVWVTTETGSTNITSGSITTGGVQAAGIIVQGSGDVVIDSGQISTAGPFAAGISAAGDDIDITSDAITTAGAASTGIFSPTATGDVTIDSGTISTAGGPATVNGFTYISAGMALLGVDGDLSVTSDSIATTGGGGTGIVAYVDGQASIVSGAITTSGTAARGIDIQALGGVSVTSQSITTTGASTIFNGETVDAMGIYASSDGPITIDSGTISTQGGLSDGIYADGAGVVTVTSDQITTTGMGAFGIRAEGDGPITVTSGSIVTTGHNVIEGERPDASGIYAGTTNGPIIIDSGAVSTAGDLVHGIWARSHGSISVTSDELTTTGDSAQGILVWSDLGDITIVAGRTATSGDYILDADINYDAFYADAITAVSHAGDTSITSEHASADGLYGSAIVALASGGGDILIDSGLATGSGDGGTVIYADGTEGAGSNVVVISDSIIASGDGQGALSAVSSGDVTVTSGSIVSGGGAFQGYDPTALIAHSSDGDVVVTSGSISTVGDRTVGILATADAGSVSLTSETITTQSARGIMASAPGAITIDSGFIHSAVPQGGEGAHAIMVTAGAGDVSITSDEIETAGMRSNGISVSGEAFIGYGERDATGGTGALTIDSGSIVTTGPEAWGIGVDHIGAIDITSGSIDAHGAGIHVYGGSTVDITSGSLKADGGPGIVVYGEDAAVKVTSGDVWVSDASDVGIAVLTDAGDITITAGETITNRLDLLFDIPSDGIEGLSNTGVVSITSDTVSTKGISSRGILAASGGAVSVDSGSVTTSGDFTYGIVAESDAAVSVLSDSVVATGDGGHGMYAWSHGDDLTIVSGSVSTSGALLDSNRPYAILAGATGDLSVTSTAISTVGDRGLGISVVAGGSILVDSGSIATAGDEATGIWSAGDGSAAVGITSDAITTSGDRANGITVGATTWMDYGWRAATGGTGALTIDSGSITTAGNEAFGIAVDHQGPMSITSDSIVSSGVGGTGIYVWGGDAITIDSGDIEAEAAAIVAFGGVGDIDITSGSITMGELGDAGIYAESTTGDITIDAGTTTLVATGFPWDLYVANAVFAWSDFGAVNITSDDASTAGTNGVAVGARGGTIVIDSGVTLATGEVGRGVYARSHTGSVTITSDHATATGDGGVGVFAVGKDGLTINSGVAASSGDRILAEDESFIWSHAIYGEALAGSITATVGDTTATGAFADGVRLTAFGEGASINLTVNGDVSSSQAYGAYLGSSGRAIVNVAASGSATGAYAGINVESEAGATIVNRGVIQNTASSGNDLVDYAAINIAGEAPAGSTIVNSGSIIGHGDGPAVWLDSGDDVVTLQTGSVITGHVLGGGGFDVVNLAGTSTSATQAQSLAHFVEFERLNVVQGYWTATGHQNEFDNVFIGANGGLEVRDFLSGGEYLSAIATGSVVNNGVLVLKFSDSVEDAGDVSVTGTGIMRFAGAGTYHVNTNAIAHTGGTIIDAGKLVLTSTLQGDLVINAGGTFQLGDGGTAGTFAGDILDNGTLIFNRSDAYEFTGGLYGSGSLVKMGDSQLFLSGDYGFTGTTTVLGGTLKLANIDPEAELEVGGGELDLSGGDHEVAGLSGDDGEVNVDDGSLTVNTTGTSEFGGTITGGGDLTVSGQGTLNLTGDNTYTGTTTVDGGTLKVNGSIVSDVFIEQGGTLGGNGTVADVNVEEGGTVGPGNSIGLLNVAGDIAFGPGSFYEVEVNAAGQSDRIVATGDANLTGGTVQVLAEAGTYNRLTTYNILSAVGGVDGEFDDVTTNFAYLTASLDYTANDVLLTLARNDLAFSALAAGANQVAVADAVEAGGEDLFDAILFQTDEGAQAAFDALSGEFYGASTTALLAQSRYSREATLGRLRDAEEGSGVWAAAYGAHQTWDGGETTAARNNLGGVMLGADVGMGAWRLGAAIGQERSRTKVAALDSRSETETTTLAGYGGFGLGALAARVGVSHAMHDIEADRDVTFPDFADATTADFEGTTTQLFGELGYKMPLAGGTFEPFANVAAARVTTDAFTETGGAAALDVEESEREVVFSSVGARFTLHAQLPYGVASPYASLAYGAASGDTDGVSAHAFDTDEAFTVTGASLSDNALLLDTGFDWQITDSAQAGFGYQGAFGDDADEQSVRVEFSLKF